MTTIFFLSSNPISISHGFQHLKFRFRSSTYSFSTLIFLNSSGTIIRHHRHESSSKISDISPHHHLSPPPTHPYTYFQTFRSHSQVVMKFSHSAPRIQLIYLPVSSNPIFASPDMTNNIAIPIAYKLTSALKYNDIILSLTDIFPPNLHMSF